MKRLAASGIQKPALNQPVPGVPERPERSKSSAGGIPSFPRGIPTGAHACARANDLRIVRIGEHVKMRRKTTMKWR